MHGVATLYNCWVVFFRKFAISFHTFLCMTFHVVGSRRYDFCIRFPWSSDRYFFLGSSRNPGFEQIPEVCHNVIAYCTHSLSTIQKKKNVVEEWCWFFQISENFPSRFHVFCFACHWYRPHTQIRIILFHDVQRDIPNLEFSPSTVSIGFSQIAFPTVVLPKDDRTNSFREERLGLPCWTMIWAICELVDVSKYLDILTLDSSITSVHLQSWPGCSLSCASQ